MAALWVPPSLNLRVKYLVSTPLIPGTPWFASQSESVADDLQLETTGLSDRTTAAETCGMADS
jgi:hypothetical protein